MAYNKIFDQEKILFLKEFNRIQGLKIFYFETWLFEKKNSKKDLMSLTLKSSIQKVFLVIFWKNL